MNVIELDRRDRAGVWRWLRLPFEVYRDIPQWVPPIQQGERARFKDDYPFYQHSEAAFFMAEEGGRVVGRLAVMDHRKFNEYKGTRDALLYLYEAFADDAIAAALFEAAERWAGERGLERLVGPKGFLTAEGLGLLVDGFEHHPALGIPYNPAYYVRHWEDVGGMKKEIDYFSAYGEREGFEYPERVQRLAEKIEKRRGFHVPEFKTRKELLQHAQSLVETYNTAFGKADIWAFTPIPPAELEEVVNRLMLIGEPRLMKLIFKDDQVAGFTFSFPDISNSLRRWKGELHPLALLDILIERQRTPWLNVNGNGIHPDYQGLGANAMLYNALLKSLVDNEQFKYVDMVQMQENNLRMLSDVSEILPLTVYKTHRIYHKTLAEA